MLLLALVAPACGTAGGDDDDEALRTTQFGSDYRGTQREWGVLRGGYELTLTCTGTANLTAAVYIGDERLTSLTTRCAGVTAQRFEVGGIRSGEVWILVDGDRIEGTATLRRA